MVDGTADGGAGVAQEISLTGCRTISFRFQLSDRTLFSINRCVVVRAFGIGEAPDDDPTLDCSESGMLLRSMPVGQCEVGIDTVERLGRTFVRYVQKCLPRYYIDMSIGFEAYTAKFSGKTRSTIQRKIKKFGEISGGRVRFERYRSVSEVDRFGVFAREVSRRTYQERLLGAGLPEAPEFVQQARLLAQADLVRAFVLFDGDRPVAYLYCPAHDGVLEYSYMGYDPDYQRYSVGTVLQWVALELLFAEGCYRCFDFTEGESEHKRLFATHHYRAANVVLLPNTFSNRILVHSHFRFAKAIERIGAWLEAHQLKRKVRRWLRFGRAAIG
jgi:CelD/BcsL family acetyltransferase involved in cellulose biosynthesis